MCCKNYKIILFDLDGTLTDPAEGITNSVAYALKHYGINVADKKELECFIGPPLFASFEKYYGFSHEKAVEAVEKYREYFSVTGIFENKLYSDTKNALDKIKKAGKKIVLATSKPEVFAKKILEYFELDEYFDIVVGSLLNGHRVNKADVIKYALEKAEEPNKNECIMIGDRCHDIIGAKENGIDSIGVLYGYGSRQELCDAGADYIAENFEDIVDIIL